MSRQATLQLSTSELGMSGVEWGAVLLQKIFKVSTKIVKCKTVLSCLALKRKLFSQVCQICEVLLATN